MAGSRERSPHAERRGKDRLAGRKLFPGVFRGREAPHPGAREIHDLAVVLPFRHVEGRIIAAPRIVAEVSPLRSACKLARNPANENRRAAAGIAMRYRHRQAKAPRLPAGKDAAIALGGFATHFTNFPNFATQTRGSSSRDGAGVAAGFSGNPRRGGAR